MFSRNILLILILQRQTSILYSLPNFQKSHNISFEHYLIVWKYFSAYTGSVIGNLPHLRVNL